MPSIGLILTPGFADWEYALIAGVGSGYYGLDVRFFSPFPGQIRSLGGLPVSVESGLDACLDWHPNIVGIVGGTIWESADAPEIGSFIRNAHASGSIVAGICGGTLALARAGLLDSVPHTSNSAEFLKCNAPDYAGAEFYRDSPSAIVADRIITAPGSAPVTFAAAIFAAAGIDAQTVTGFKAMLATEHGGAKISVARSS